MKDPHDAEDVLHVDKESTDYHSDPPVSPGQGETPTLISKEEAKQIALNHAGLQASAITDYECELDRDDGKIIYEIIFDHGHVEYEYDIDATTVKVISWEKDSDKEAGGSQSGNRGETGTTDPPPTDPQLISAAEAKAIAPEKAGLTAGQIREYEYERDKENGITVYEISFQYGNKEYEFEINAVTGKIIHWEVEIDD